MYMRATARGRFQKAFATSASPWYPWWVFIKHCTAYCIWSVISPISKLN